MNVDLHCHSNVSDGALAPAEVARRAAGNGVQVWALTDYGFAASRGSDFHGPQEGAQFGTLPPLDPALRPVWRDWTP